MSDYSGHQNVDQLDLDGRKIYLIGTAHISKASADLVDELIHEIKPAAVAVELCSSRLEALRDPHRWKSMDIVAVIRQGRAYVLITQLLLAAFQRKLGQQLDIKPGAEMLSALKAAEAVGAQTITADRDIRITLRRTWGAVGLFSLVKLTFSILSSSLSSEKISAEEIERMKSADALEELLGDFTAVLPDVRRTLIDERDRYLAQRIRETPGETVVAVVGAGHVPGIKQWIQKDQDISELEELPPPRRSLRIIAWAIPVSVVGLLIGGFWYAGLSKITEMALTWIVINSSLAGLGALLALGHPLTIATAVVVSPFTSLNPTVAAGWFAGLVEALVRKPRVQDLESVLDDIAQPFPGWWRNRVIKVLLVVALTNLLGTIGTLVGIERLISALR